MKRRFFPMGLLALAFATASVGGQSPKVVLVADRLGFDVERSLHCKPHTDAGAGNADLINTSLFDTNQRYPLYFPGKRWNVQETLVNNYTGRRWCGNGLARPDSGLGNSWNILNGPASEIVWNKDQIDFDGSDVSASTADDASTTLEVAGVSNTSELLYYTLRITGGTNFVPGTYAVLAVNGNDLTLDRDPSSGGAGSGLTGTLQASLIRDEGFGNVYDGLALYGSSGYPYDSQTFNSGNPANHCAVLMHFLSKTDATPNGAKANVENVTVADADVGFLCSIGLDENHDVYDVQSTASDNYKSADFNNSDHVSFSKILAQNIDTLFQVRTTQGLSYLFWDVYTSNVKTLFYVERGGKLKASGIWTTTNAVDGPTLLRIGGSSGGTPTQSATVSSPISIDGFTFDAPSQNLKLLEADSTRNASYEVELANGTINEPYKRVAATPAAGTAQSGAATSIVLAAATDQVDDFYSGSNIRLTAGTGAGQVRSISNYVGASDTVTVSTNWTVTPDSTTAYEITNEGTAQGGTASTLVLDADTDQANSQFVGKVVKITGGRGVGQIRGIENYSQATDTITVNVDWQVIPDSTTTYEIYTLEKGDYYDVETPVVTATDGAFVTLRNINPILPNWVRLSNSSDDFKPRVLITGCVLQGPEGYTPGGVDDVVLHPELVIDDDNSQPGTEVCFVGNVSHGFDDDGGNFGGPFLGHRFCREGVWIVGTGWKEPNVYDLEDRVETLEEAP